MQARADKTPQRGRPATDGEDDTGRPDRVTICRSTAVASQFAETQAPGWGEVAAEGRDPARNGHPPVAVTALLTAARELAWPVQRSTPLTKRFLIFNINIVKIS